MNNIGACQLWPLSKEETGDHVCIEKWPLFFLLRLVGVTSVEEFVEDRKHDIKVMRVEIS